MKVSFPSLGWFALTDIMCLCWHALPGALWLDYSTLAPWLKTICNLASTATYPGEPALCFGNACCKLSHGLHALNMVICNMIAWWFFIHVFIIHANTHAICQYIICPFFMIILFAFKAIFIYIISLHTYISCYFSMYSESRMVKKITYSYCWP